MPTPFHSVLRRGNAYFHAVAGEAITVRLADGTEYAATGVFSGERTQLVDTVDGVAERKFIDCKVNFGDAVSDPTGITRANFRGTIARGSETWAVDQVLNANATAVHLSLTELRPREDTGPTTHMRYQR